MGNLVSRQQNGFNSIDGDRTAPPPDQADDRFQDCGPTGSVSPQKSDDFSRADSQINPVENMRLTVISMQTGNAQHLFPGGIRHVHPPYTLPKPADYVKPPRKGLPPESRPAAGQ